jgi:hypothetical protein
VKKDEKTTKKKSAGKDAGGEEEGKTKLDFSNLIKHKIVELRNYCRENGSPSSLSLSLLRVRRVWLT